MFFFNLRYKGQAPDLLGKQDSVYEGNLCWIHLFHTLYLCFTPGVPNPWFGDLFVGHLVLGDDDDVSFTEDWDMLDVDEDDKLTGEEEFELLTGPLGLTEKRIVPEAVQFPDSDPLGASVAMVTAANSMEETLLQIGEEENEEVPPMSVIIGTSFVLSWFVLFFFPGCQTSVDKTSSGRVTLGEQATALQNPHDRVMALRRVTAAAQVLLARTMVMRALSLLSVR